jgi:hypothetical protein
MAKFKDYRDVILFLWGIIVLTLIIFLHIVTDPEVYLILAAAIGLPLVIGLRRNGNGSEKSQ